jgi:putative membrane protein
MKKASRVFPGDDRKRIAEAVQAAESKTSAEIVPVVATSSGRYDRSEDVIGLWIGAIALVVVWVLFQDAKPAEWGGTKLVISLPIVLGIIVGGWLLGVLIANQVGWLRRLFTPRKELRAEVQQAASKAFFDSRVHHTAGSTGVLIYVSLFEHVAVILADQQVTEKLGQEKLDQFRDDLTGVLKEGKYTDAFCKAIEEIGTALGEILPRAEHDKNELADALVVMD